METNWHGFVEDVLLRTYVAVKGNSPDAGCYRPDDETIRKLLLVCGEEEDAVAAYCKDALCGHLYSAAKSGTHAPFWVNSRLTSDNMLTYIRENRGFIRQRFAGVLSAPTTFFTEVYSDIVETEIDYLTLRAEFEFRDMPFDWSMLQPTLYWYMFVVEGVAEIPCKRMTAAVPQHWANLPVACQNDVVDMEVAVMSERRRLADAAARRVFINAVEKALYETARQWCENMRLMKLYLDRHRRVAISPEFSAVSSVDIEVTWPLLARDKALFAKAKEVLESRGAVFPPFDTPVDDRDMFQSFETSGNDDDFAPGSMGRHGVIHRGGKSLEGALAAITASPDD